LSSSSPTITRQDGSSFDFIAVDLFRIGRQDDPLVVLGFLGTHSDGSVTRFEDFQITEYRPRFSATGFPFHTFNQPGNFGVDFTDLTSLQVYQPMGDTFQFDNLVLTEHLNAVPVPKPSALATLTLLRPRPCWT